MSMDKRWAEILNRLDAIEAVLSPISIAASTHIDEFVEARLEERIAEIQADAPATAATVTKEQLMGIKGVGSSTADEILKLLNS